MNRVNVLVSSFVLEDYLDKCKLDDYDQEQYTDIVVQGGFLRMPGINDSGLQVDCKTDFDVQRRIACLTNLKRLTKITTDQPITLVFSDSHFIEINGLLL